MAARMRPQTLDEKVGQQHIIGEGRLLRRAIQADRLFSSIIFTGPPEPENYAGAADCTVYAGNNLRASRQCGRHSRTAA